MKIKLEFFIFGIVLGLFTLCVSPSRVQAYNIPLRPTIDRLFSLPSIDRLFSLPSIDRLFSLPGFIRPLRPLIPIRSGPIPTQAVDVTLTPTVAPTDIPIPTATAATTPTLTLTPTPTTEIPTMTPTPTTEIIVTPTPTTEIILTQTPTPTEILETPTLTPTEIPTLTPTPTDVGGTPTPELVAFWKVEPGDDSTVTDYSPHGYKLQLMGNTGTLPVLSDEKATTTQTTTRSLYFDGSNYAQLEVPANEEYFDFSKEFTMETWVKADSEQPAGQPESGLISKWQGGGSGVIMAYGNGPVSIWIGENHTPDTLNINDNSWHHVAMTWDKATVETYIDGISRTSDPYTGTPSMGGRKLLIGSYATDGRNFKGYLDEIKVYKGALTQAQIQQDAGVIEPTATIVPTITLTPTEIIATPTEIPTMTPTTTLTPTPTGGTAQVVINEFMPKPTPGYDWIELYNPTLNEVNISNWQLKDNAKSAMEVVPTGTKIGGNGYITFDVSDRLNNGGDTIYLYDNNDIIIDEKSYIAGEVVENVSIGRKQDGLGLWQQCSNSSYNSTNDGFCALLP